MKLTKALKEQILHHIMDRTIHFDGLPHPLVDPANSKARWQVIGVEKENGDVVNLPTPKVYGINPPFVFAHTARFNASYSGPKNDRDRRRWVNLERLTDAAIIADLQPQFDFKIADLVLEVISEENEVVLNTDGSKGPAWPSKYK